MEPQSDNSSEQQKIQTQQQRRPRGFAARAAAEATAIEMESMSPNDSGGGGKGKKEREREKERTKLRERHRRAITSRMLAGLRQYGNFTLPARADMNDVLAALARQAGWSVDPDGTTYRSSPAPPPPLHIPPSPMIPYPVRSIESPVSTTALKNCSTKAPLDCQTPVHRIEGNLSPAVSLDSSVVAERGPTNRVNSSQCLEADQLMRDVGPQEHVGDYTGTPYIPVYVMLPTGVVNNFCQLVDPEGIRQELTQLKSLHVDGVVVQCLWGIVEGWNPQKYTWDGYRDLFDIIRQFTMKIQVVMAFHESDVNESGDIPVSLPKWVLDLGRDNQDIFFTDREGRRNTECLSWGIDKERALKGRTGIEVYFDFIRSFRTEFDDLFVEGLISAVEIGLGASGELKYPAFPEKMGWTYPGIGEFQCYDKYLQQSLRKAAKVRGHLFWARGPDNAGQYNSRPHETGFFCDRGDYDNYYGHFFLQWYAQTLVDHADNVLSLASLAFEGAQLIVKIPSVYWWYKTSSHAAELAAGFYNPTNHDGYSPLFNVLKKHSVTMKYVFPRLLYSGEENDEAFADPDGLSWQVLNSAWDSGLLIAGQNTMASYDREGYLKILETAKPRNDPDSHHLSFFVYQQPSSSLQREFGFSELDSSIKCMHGNNFNPA
ncbi:hypothetical protein C5167_049399 [Papaver somniferum]|uniref:Beta-amylase n=1 Tax=Papaver somniferum TaxID=3469 RepID=A0A4Y7KNG4_PAPSO|nr:beta-amylase 8-like [Papaver somniferum]RZC73922.1 hypothetical protein C5167_049399 [Papaver somniferum]